MEEEVYADSMDGGPTQRPPSPDDSDWDSDEVGHGRDPRSEGHPVSSNVYFAHARLRLYNKYVSVSVVTVSLIFSSSRRRRNDQRIRETRYANMHVFWGMHLPSLVERYLEWKHNGLVNLDGDELASCYQFEITTVDVFDPYYVLLRVR